MQTNLVSQCSIHNFVCAWFWWHCLHACFCCHLKGLLFLSITVDDDSSQTAFLHPTVSYMKNLDWANLKQQLSIFIYKALLQRLPADLRSLIEFKHSTYLVRSRDILTSPFCWFHTELGKNWCKILCCLDMKQALKNCIHCFYWNNLKYYICLSATTLAHVFFPLACITCLN